MVGWVRWHRGPKPRFNRNPCFFHFPNSHAAAIRRYSQIAFSASQGPDPGDRLVLAISLPRLQPKTSNVGSLNSNQMLKSSQNPRRTAHKPGREENLKPI